MPRPPLDNTKPERAQQPPAEVPEPQPNTNIEPPEYETVTEGYDPKTSFRDLRNMIPNRAG